MKDLEIQLLGEKMRLLAERALFWPARNIVFVADLHLGKAASFRAGGIPVPGGTTSEILERLTGVLKKTSANRIIILGDLLHSAEAKAAPTMQRLAQWRKQHQSVSVTLVRGNHDRKSGVLPDSMEITIENELMVMDPFVLAHEPQSHTDGFVLCGHWHPGVKLKLAGHNEKLACFWVSDGYAVLPAFGSFTGYKILNPRQATRLYVWADQTVIPVTQ